MLSGWSRIFVFVAVAAVIANAHCFGNCASEICIKKRNRISALVLNRKSSSFAPPTASPDSYPHSMAM